MLGDVGHASRCWCIRAIQARSDGRALHPGVASTKETESALRCLQCKLWCCKQEPRFGYFRCPEMKDSHPILLDRWASDIVLNSCNVLSQRQLCCTWFETILACKVTCEGLLGICLEKCYRKIRSAATSFHDWKRIPVYLLNA